MDRESRGEAIEIAEVRDDGKGQNGGRGNTQVQVL